MQDSKKLKQIAKALLEEIGENPKRIGLKDTPKRMARMWVEVFKGYDQSKMPKITVFPNNEDGIAYDQIIVDQGTFNSYCLIGDTQIKTIKGIFRIKDLVGKEEKVFCYDEKNKKFTISLANQIRKTQEKTEIWKLTTDRNTVYATPNHKFLTYNRGWIELKNLNPYDSLVALNTSINDNYLVINGQKKEHNFIYEEITKTKIKKGYVIHHKDKNKLNNDIDNLQCLSNSNHMKLHAIEYMKSLSEKEKSEIGKKANWGFLNLKNTNPEKYKQVKEKAKNSLKRLYNSEEGKKLRKLKSEKGKIWWKKNRDSDAVKERNKKISIKAIGNKNHKVIKCEFYGYEDVYNMEVEKYHNFVANNLVVHNCEHHMALFSGQFFFGYIADQHIIGLSKIARTIDYFSNRMQVQERLGHDVVNFLEHKLKPKGMILILKAHHSCKEIRGVKKRGEMITSVVRGLFASDPSTKAEFISLINLK